MGAGAGEGQKVPEAYAAAVLLRLLKTLDLREAVIAERRAQVTPRGLSRLRDSASVGPWQPSGFLRPQFTHLWRVSGGGGCGHPEDLISHLRKGTGLDLSRKEAGKWPQTKVKFSFTEFFQ